MLIRCANDRRTTLRDRVADVSAHATGTSVDVAVITDEGYRLFPCTADGPACRHLILASTERRAETVVDCDEDEESEDEESVEPERTSEAWRRTLSIDPDRMTHLRVESGEAPSHPAPGDRPLDDLMNLLR